MLNNFLTGLQNLPSFSRFCLKLGGASTCDTSGLFI
jgi:hypothetical protein